MFMRPFGALSSCVTAMYVFEEHRGDHSLAVHPPPKTRPKEAPDDSKFSLIGSVNSIL